MHYYNEIDRKAAAWLRELMADGLIPRGEVDERSILDVRAADLRGFVQCHFFAGIGGWARALRLAGWPEDRPVWTGSCPCQPFSCAGKGLGVADERHLWPAFGKLIGECRPAIVFGEQVASAAGREWLAGVFADLEGMAYSRAAADLCAAGVGAPHIRQRLYWCGVDNTTSARHASEGERPELRIQRGGECLPRARRAEVRVADTELRRFGPERDGAAGRGESECGDQCGGVGDADGGGLPVAQGRVFGKEISACAGQTPAPGGPILSFWRDAIWHACRDGKARRISHEPALFPLAHGLPGRVGLLRGAGNAIVAPLAAEFIRAAVEAGEAISESVNQ